MQQRTPSSEGSDSTGAARAARRAAPLLGRLLVSACGAAAATFVLSVALHAAPAGATSAPFVSCSGNTVTMSGTDDVDTVTQVEVASGVVTIDGKGIGTDTSIYASSCSGFAPSGTVTVTAVGGASGTLTNDIDFVTDGSSVAFVGNDSYTTSESASSSLAVSGSGTLAPTGTSTATFGSGTYVGAGTTTYSGIGGTISSSDQKAMLDVPSGSTATVATVGSAATDDSASFTLSGGASPASTFTQGFAGFTTVDAASASGAVSFTADGSSASLTGNDASGSSHTSLHLSGSAAVQLSATAGAGTAGSTSWSDVGGTITDTGGTLDLSKLTAGTAGSPTPVSVASSTAPSQSADGQHLAGFTTFDASGATSGVFSFSSDGSNTSPITLEGGGTTSNLTLSGAGTTVQPSGSGAGTVDPGSSGSGQIAYSGLSGTITDTGSGTATVDLSKLSGTVAVTIAPLASQSADGQDLAGFTTFDASGATSGVFSFSSDGSNASPITLKGGGTTSNLTLGGADTTVQPSGPGAGTVDPGSGSGQIAYSTLSGTITDTGSGTATVDLSKLTAGTAGSPTPVSVASSGSPSQSADGQHLAGFTTFDASGATSGVFSFSSDGSNTSPITLKGSGTTSNLTLSGADTTVQPSGPGAGTVDPGSAVSGQIAYSTLSGTITDTGGTLDLSKLTAGTAGSPTPVSVASSTAPSQSADGQHLAGFTTFDASGATSGVFSFSSDGSNTSPITLEGGGTTSNLTLSGAGMTVQPSGSGAGTVDPGSSGSGQIAYSGLSGTITDTGGTLDLSKLSGTVAVTIAPLASQSADGQDLAGFTTFDASGATSGVFNFSSDGSNASPVTLEGGGTTSNLTLSGADTTVQPSGAGSGTIDPGSAVSGQIAYSTLSGTITDTGSGTATVDLSKLTAGTAGSPTPVSVASSGSPSQSADGQHLAGFTTFDASGATSGVFSFSSDGSNTSPITLKGSGTTSNLTLSGADTTVQPSGPGAGTVDPGSAVSGQIAYSTLSGTITDTGGTLDLSKLTAGTAGSPTPVSVASSTAPSQSADGQHLAGFTTFDASGATSGVFSFSSDGSNTSPITLEGGGTTSNLTLSGAGMTVQPSGSGAGTVDPGSSGSGQIAYSGLSGTITDTGGTLDLSKLSGTVAVTIAPLASQSADGQDLAGFTTFDASGATSGVFNFSSDGSNASPVTLEGGGTTSNLTLSGAGTTVQPSGPGAGTVDPGSAVSGQIAYSTLSGTITDTGSGTATVDLSKLSGTVAVTIAPLASQSADGQHLAGFTTFDASGATSGVFSFSSDGSNTSPITLKGGGTTNLTLSGADTTVQPSGAGSGTVDPGSSGSGQITYSGLSGTITDTGSGTATVDLSKLSGTVAVTIAPLASQSAGGQDLAGFTTFDASGAASGVFNFSSDGSNASPVTLEGGGTTSNLTLSGAGMTVQPSGAGSGTVDPGSGSGQIAYSGLSGTITDTGGTLDLSKLSGTVAVTIAPLTHQFAGGQDLAGFTTFDASGATSGVFNFSSDGSNASPITLEGGGTTSNLTLSGAGMTVQPSGAGSGTVDPGSAVSGQITYSGLSGTIKDTGSGGSLSLPASVTSATITISGGTATTTYTTSTGSQSLNGFAALDASNVSGPVSFVTDGSLAAGLTGNGTDTTLLITGSPVATMTVSIPGAGTIAFSSVTTTFSGVGGEVEGPSTVALVLQPAGTASASVVVSDSTVTTTLGVGGSSGSYDGFTNVNASAVSGTVTFSTDGTLPARFTGNGGGSTLDLAAAPTEATVTVNLNTDSVAGLSNDPSFNAIDNVIGSNGTFVVDAGAAPGVLRGGTGTNTFVMEPAADVVIEGAGSSNTIDLSTNASGAVSLDLSDPSFQSTGGDGTILVMPGAAYSVIGSRSGSTIVGGPGGGTITGTAGAGSSDYLSEGTGSAVLDAAGASGSETLVGSTSTANETLEGGSGTNYVAPGDCAGGCTLSITTVEGGIDWLDFADAPSAVSVNLSGSATSYVPVGATTAVSVAAGIGGGWLGPGETLPLGLAVDNVIGSSFNDVIAANNANDEIESDGSAVILPGSGNDVITCTAGSDCTVDYENIPFYAGVIGLVTDPGITVSAGANGTGTVTKWADRSTDTLSGVSTIVSTDDGNDSLSAWTTDQVLVALGGTDLLQASSDGYDTLIGGDGSGTTTFEVGPSNGAYYSGAGHDTMIARSGLNYFLAWMVNTSTSPYSLFEGYNTIVAATGGAINVIYSDPSDLVSGPDGQQLDAVNTTAWEILTGFAQNNQPIVTYPLSPG